MASSWFLVTQLYREVFALSGFEYMPPTLYSVSRRHSLETYTGMRRITTFRSTTDRIFDSVPIIEYYNTDHCVTTAYSIQYSNMLYRFVA